MTEAGWPAGKDRLNRLVDAQIGRRELGRGWGWGDGRAVSYLGRCWSGYSFVRHGSTFLKELTRSDEFRYRRGKFQFGDGI